MLIGEIYIFMAYVGIPELSDKSWVQQDCGWGSWCRKISKNESLLDMMFELRDCPIPPAWGGETPDKNQEAPALCSVC